jgi:predicted transcriptional regulator
MGFKVGSQSDLHSTLNIGNYHKARYDVKPDTKISEVLEKFTQVQVHHFWIIDSQEHPVGIVSMTDVLRFIYSLLPIGDILPNDF